MGRKATPTKLLKLRGSPEAGFRRGEPDLPDGSPVCPEWLEDDAKVVWGELRDNLDLLGILGVTDRDAMARYAAIQARWIKAQKVVAEKGESIEVYDDEGRCVSVRRRTESVVMDRYCAQLLALTREFGLTPSARRGLSVRIYGSGAPKQTTGLQKYLAKQA